MVQGIKISNFNNNVVVINFNKKEDLQKYFKTKMSVIKKEKFDDETIIIYSTLDGIETKIQDNWLNYGLGIYEISDDIIITAEDNKIQRLVDFGYEDLLTQQQYWSSNCSTDNDEESTTSEDDYDYCDGFLE